MNLAASPATWPHVVPGYAFARIAAAHVVFRTDLHEFVRQAIADAGTLVDYAANHDQVEAIAGRGPLYIMPGPGGARWVVRKLRHGGLLAPLTGDRFLRIGTPRPFNELLMAARLHELGIPTPPVVAAAVYPGWLTYRGEVARQEVRDARDLAACLFGEPAATADTRAEALAAAGRLVASLHSAGIIHPDLNLRNVLIEHGGAGPRALIIDLEKCRSVRRLSPLARRAMLRRFRRSARRFEERGGAPLSAAEWDAFRDGYRG